MKYAIIDNNDFVVDVISAPESYLKRLKEIYKNNTIIEFKKEKQSTLAAIGYYYNKNGKYFVPYKSWTCDKDGKYVPFKPYPNDGKEYYWNESTKNWIEAVRP